MNEKILRFLPKFYAKSDSDSGLRQFANGLIRRLLEIEKDLIRINLSRYVDFASSDVLARSPTEDLDRIGALFDIERVIERVVPDTQLDEGQKLEAHLRHLARYRQRLKDTIKIFLGGLATARAIVHTVAAVFGLETIDVILPDDQKDVAIDGITIPIKTDKYTTSAIVRRPERQAEAFRLDIIDNPSRNRARSVIDQEASLAFALMHKGLEGVHPKITISTGRDPAKIIGTLGQSQFNGCHFDFSVPLKFPVLENRRLGQMLIFNDIIPSEKQLSITFAEKRFRAYMEAEDVSDRLFFMSSARFNRNQFDQAHFGFVFQNPRHREQEPGRFGAGRFNQAIFSEVDPAAVLDPFLIPGENRWRYNRLQKAYLPGSRVKGLMDIMQDQTHIFPREIRFEWQERARAAFGVRLPRGIGFLAGDQERELFESTVKQVKAAGVEPIFDYQNIFPERHDISAMLTSIGYRPASKTETHEQKSSYSINGLFGRTYFKSSVFGT